MNQNPEKNPEQMAFFKFKEELKPTKGWSTVVELDPETYEEVRRHEFDNFEDRHKLFAKIWQQPMAIVSFIDDDLHYSFYGRTFSQHVDLSNGKTESFELTKDVSKIDFSAEKAKKDLKALYEILGASRK